MSASDVAVIAGAAALAVLAVLAVDSWLRRWRR
jgi:hypothetical protein